MKTKILIVAFLSILIGCNSSEFNSDKWKQGDKRQRGKMSTYLIENQIIDNKSKNEVTELLGNPDSKSGNCISYDLDLGGISKQVNWTYFLEICFDEKSGKSNYVQIND